MGILDKIFGSDSNSNRTKDLDDSYIDQYDEWPYMFTPYKSELYDGRELYTIDKNDEVWMGEHDRNIIESKKEKPNESTYVGWSETEDGIEDVSIDFDALFRHILLLGQSGYGKSTLMRNMMLQWINGGHGVCYIDRKGQDSKRLVEQIPSRRIDDVEYINFSLDQNNKAVFNIFENGSDKDTERYKTEVEILSTEFTKILKQESENWDRDLGYVINRIVKTQIENQSFFDMQDCLLDIIFDKDRQDQFIKKNDMDKQFVNRLSQLDTSKYESVFSFLRDIEESPVINQILTNEETNLNLGEAVQNGKILIIDTSSIYSEFERNIITKMVISRIWSTIKLRGLDYNELDPYFLCLDEYQNIASRYGLSDIISQARSYKLSIFLSCQSLTQVPEDSKMRLQQMDSLFTFNPAMPNNMSEVADMLGDVEAWDLGELERFELMGRSYMNGTQQSSMNINTPAKYPKLRDFDNFTSDSNIDNAD